jgi:hypothetical protein
MTQNNLGATLQALGARERERAGQGGWKRRYRPFARHLRTTPGERVPLQWAPTSNNLGNAFEIGGAGERYWTRHARPSGWLGMSIGRLG